MVPKSFHGTGDIFGAAQAATAHMLQKGRRKPGYLGVTLLDKAVGLARREGFDSALRDACLLYTSLNR